MHEKLISVRGHQYNIPTQVFNHITRLVQRHKQYKKSVIELRQNAIALNQTINKLTEENNRLKGEL